MSRKRGRAPVVVAAAETRKVPDPPRAPPRRRFLALAGAAAGGSAVTSWYFLRGSATQAVQPPAQGRAVQQRRTFEGRPGPWGQLIYTRVAISIPAEYAAPEEAEATPWFFGGMKPADVKALLASSGLAARQIARIEQAKWEVRADGTAVLPPRDVVLELEPAVRSKLYGALAGFPQNTRHRFPEIFYPEFVDERTEASGLPPPALALFRRLLYPRGSWLLFSDPDLVASQLPTAELRVRFGQMLHRKVTFLVSLRVDRDTDLRALTAYWNYPGRAKGLAALFESLARVPGGGTLDLAHLLPPFARKRIYTYPDPEEVRAETISGKRDCVWASLNFFRDQPDDRFVDGDYARSVIDGDYDEVTTPAFGDLVALLDRQRDSVHFAVYVAEDLAFTKNGFSAGQPYMFMKLDALRDLYSATRPPDDRLDIVFLRRKRP
jgi:hypothetical protein